MGKKTKKGRPASPGLIAHTSSARESMQASARKNSLNRDPPQATSFKFDNVLSDMDGGEGKAAAKGRKAKRGKGAAVETDGMYE